MMEKGSWEREGKAGGGVAELQTFTLAPEQLRINATVKYAVSTLLLQITS